jgi:DNA-directed RNA polymerase specialized sigma24 family protein
MRQTPFRMLGYDSAALTRAQSREGWLTTVVARLCLDMLRSRKSRREKWLAFFQLNHSCSLRLSFPRTSSVFFAAAAISAARSFAIRSMSFTGTGLVRGNWTVPFRSS